jgi:uncharacterized protein
MRSFLAVLLLLTLTTALLQPATPAALADDDEDLKEYVDEAIADVDAYWKGQATTYGFRYTSPKIVLLHGGEVGQDPSCGEMVGDHFYCYDTSTMYLDYDSDEEWSFASLWDEGKQIVIVTTLAHEWGHHVQNLTHVADDKQSIDFELQADCFMGVFSRYAKQQGWVEKGDMAIMLADTREAGDDPDSDPSAPDAHGSPQQRQDAFMKGYEGREASGCGLPKRS